MTAAPVVVAMVLCVALQLGGADAGCTGNVDCAANYMKNKADFDNILSNDPFVCCDDYSLPGNDLSEREYQEEKEEENKERLAQENVPQSLDHPKTIKAYNTLTEMTKNYENGTLHVTAGWRWEKWCKAQGLNWPAGVPTRRYETLSIPFPFNLRRLAEGGHLWIQVSEFTKQRPGMNDNSTRDASTTFASTTSVNSKWARLYAIILGDGAQDELISSSVLMGVMAAPSSAAPSSAAPSAAPSSSLAGELDLLTDEDAAPRTGAAFALLLASTSALLLQAC